jgi:pimeloyl-ACP methyl ester carboxylesterase
VREDSVYFVSRTGALSGDCWNPTGPSAGTALLLHGGGQTRHSWRSTGPVLAERGWTTFALDFCGHGDSDWAADGRYGLDTMVDDISEIIHDLPSPPVVIGASLGGLTGLVLAGEQPDAVRGLVLADAVPTIEPAGDPQGFGSLEEVAEAVVAYQPHRRVPINLDGLRKNVRRGSDRRWYWHWDPAFAAPHNHSAWDGVDARLRAAARHVEVPTLAVRGVLSDVVSEAGFADLLAAIPHATGVDVAGAGHMVVGDDNAVFLSRVTEFLATLVPDE